MSLVDWELRLVRPWRFTPPTFFTPTDQELRTEMKRIGMEGMGNRDAIKEWQEEDPLKGFWNPTLRFLFTPIQTIFDYDYLNCKGAGKFSPGMAIERNLPFLVGHISIAVGLLGVRRLLFTLPRKEYYRDIQKEFTSTQNILVLTPQRDANSVDQLAHADYLIELTENAENITVVEIADLPDFNKKISELKNQNKKFDRIEIDFPVTAEGFQWDRFSYSARLGTPQTTTYTLPFEAMAQENFQFLNSGGQIVLLHSLNGALTMQKVLEAQGKPFKTPSQILNSIRTIFTKQPSKLIATGRILTYPLHYYLPTTSLESLRNPTLHRKMLELFSTTTLFFLGLNISKVALFNLIPNYLPLRQKPTKITSFTLQ